MEVRLTTFMDFVAAEGTAKVTSVREAKAKYGQAYSPLTDFYKGVRETIIDLHESSRSKALLDTFLTKVEDGRKQPHYAAVVAGYKRWLGTKRVMWLGAQGVPWTEGDLTVRVRPDLPVQIDGTDYMIKLWFAADKLTKKRVDATLRLLEITHGKLGNVGILDVRQGRLITPTRPVRDIDALLAGEAAAFVSMWERLAA